MAYSFINVSFICGVLSNWGCTLVETRFRLSVRRILHRLPRVSCFCCRRITELNAMDADSGASIAGQQPMIDAGLVAQLSKTRQTLRPHIANIS